MDRLKTFINLAGTANIAGAIKFQHSLRGSCGRARKLREIRTICGFDIAYEKATNINFSAAVVMSFPGLELLKEVWLIDNSRFPYVPGLLAFREGLPIIKLFNKLGVRPDLLMFDGHGLAHPRGLGIATMMGILLDSPAIGSAKTRLVGKYDEPGMDKGNMSGLYYHGKVIGNVLRSRAGIRPIYVSVGWMISLKDATSLVLKCCLRYRIPEPLRQAHILANRIRLNHPS